MLTCLDAAITAAKGGRGGRIRPPVPGVGSRSFGQAKLRPYRLRELVPRDGIEPPPPDAHSGVLPLNYRRDFLHEPIFALPGFDAGAGGLIRTTDHRRMR